MSEQNKAKSITGQLWAMANELRGNLDASEFRNYILGFMFYRYLSEHQEEYLKGIGVLQPQEGESLNDAYAREADTQNLKYYLEDIAQSLGYAIEPNYTWKTIVDKVHDGDIKPSEYQEMFDEFNKNAQINQSAREDFSEIFADVNLGNSRLGNSTAARAKSLGAVVELVDTFDYQDDNGHDILGDVYEYLIAEFAGNSGKKAGEFYTPHQVSKILAKLVTLDAPSEGQFSVYDPAMGSGSLLLTVQDQISNGNESGRVAFEGQELNTTTYNLARMNLMMHGIEYQNMDLRNADTLEDDWPSREKNGVMQPVTFNAVVANPPYSARWDNGDAKMKDPRFKDYGKLAPKSKADFAFVLHALYHLDREGTMAIVLPHGVLFRNQAEGVIRKAIIEKNYLDAVIGLPEGIFFSTGIPTVVLVFKKNRKNKDILFIDASNDFEKGKKQNVLRDSDVEKIIAAYKKREDVEKYAHLADREEIEENDYNLNMPRYVDTFEEEEPVDPEALLSDMQSIDSEIAEVTKQMNEQMDDLVATDEESQKTLDILKQVLK